MIDARKLMLVFYCCWYCVGRNVKYGEKVRKIQKLWQDDGNGKDSKWIKQTAREKGCWIGEISWRFSKEKLRIAAEISRQRRQCVKKNWIE